MIPAGPASALPTYGFDESDMTAPFVLDSGLVTITTNDGANVSGDINNGDPGSWGFLAHSAPNVVKIWDNIEITLTSPSNGFEIYCSSGSMGSVTVTVTTYLNGVEVMPPIDQDLGALNEWEAVTGGGNDPIDQISIVGRETGYPSSVVPFGCDDLTLSIESATTSTQEVTTTTEDVTTPGEDNSTSSTENASLTTVLQNELADSGLDDASRAILFAVIVLGGITLVVLSRHRTEQ